MNERIKQIRKINNLSQAEFAERIKASRDKIASYETGRVVPTDTTLSLIAKEFSVSYIWLKTGEGSMEDVTGNRDTMDKLSEVYQSLPERLKTLVDVLVDMDPEWYETLEKAFAELEKRKNKKGDAE